MRGDDVVLTELADAVLEGRPFHWIAAEAGRYDATRGLIPDLEVVAGIAALANASSTSPSDGATAAARWLTPGSTWGRLTVETLVGSGSFGDVYKAFDPALDRVVALKLLRPGGPDGHATATVHEGRLMARVRHSNVATVYGAERIDDRVGLVMEFVDGRSLEEELRERGPLPEADVVSIGRDLCAALDAIHRAGLLHRDLKAQNVLRDGGGRVVVTDFGAGVEAAPGPAARELAGTPLYLAPEVLDGAAPSRHSDIYAVGVLLFHLLTGSFPVTGRSLDEVWAAHRNGRRRPLAELRRNLDPRTVATVERALDVSPAGRYGSALELATALTPVSDAPRRRLGGVPIAAALGVAVVAVAVSAWTRWVPVDSTPASSTKTLLPTGQIDVPSSDGRFVPYVDTMERAQIWDVSSNTPRSLVRDDAGVVADYDVVISPDGQALVVASRRQDDTWELRRLNQTGPLPRPLIARQSAFRPEPQEWSRDGRVVLCLLRQENGTADLALVPFDGGPLRVVHTFTADNPAGARLSPDGRFAAVVVGARDARTPAVLHLFDLENGESHSLVVDVAPFSEPAWTPDGRRVIFLKESTTVAGSREAWAIPVESGRAVGEPALAAADLGAVSWVHVLESGQLGRVLWTNSADVYTRDVDLAGGSPPSPPTRVDRDRIGNHVAPAWSPDGRQLVYFETRPAPAAGAAPLKTLVVRTMATGQTRQVATRLGFLGGYTPVWTPDASSVVVWASDDGRDERLGYYRVDLRDGSASAVVIRGQAEPANAAISPAGVFYYRDPDRGIVARVRDGLQEDVVVAGAGSVIGPFRLAHDGRRLAYLRYAVSTAMARTTLVVHEIGSRARAIASATRAEWLIVQAWTPDDRAVLYTRAAAGRPHRLWMAGLNGGPTRDLGVTFISSGGAPNGLSLHINGRSIAYPERVLLSELWITPLEHTP